LCASPFPTRGNFALRPDLPAPYPAEALGRLQKHARGYRSCGGQAFQRASGGDRLTATVDPFAVVIFSAIAAIVVSVWLVGRFYPGSGLEQVGLRSAREIAETRESLESEDLEQMLAAHNARRRARGEAEVSVGDLELRVASDLREQQRRREAYLADRDFDQLLEATNARRRARGLPERTPEQVREELQAQVLSPDQTISRMAALAVARKSQQRNFRKRTPLPKPASRNLQHTATKNSPVREMNRRRRPAKPRA